MRWPALASLAFLALAPAAMAGTPAEDWEAVVALDAGPGTPSRNVEEAKAAASRHLDQQERALRDFRAAHPGDANAFEAGVRLARLLEIRGSFQDSKAARDEAGRLLDQLEKSATPAQRVEVDFARVTRLMRAARKAGPTMRDPILAAARKFHLAHPGDRRLAALLTEVATLFDDQPKLKTTLLREADSAATDPGLKQRIADDLRRLDLLGQPLSLEFTSVQGEAIRLEDFRGRVVLIVFFADFSPPSTQALARIREALVPLKREKVAVLAVCLDPRREALDAAVEAAGIKWPVAFDGKSWDGELVRSLGVNALPTVWVVDPRGILRSINAVADPVAQIRPLLGG